MTSPDLDQQIRVVLNGYEHDAAGQIDGLTGAIRAVLDLCEDDPDAGQQVIYLTTLIRHTIAMYLEVITADEALAVGAAMYLQVTGKEPPFTTGVPA